MKQNINDLATRVRELKPVIETEEATKTALIIPFIQNILGYDVTDPREVIPEYIADIGVKKGEKVDYALKNGDDFRFLIECKKVGEHLSQTHAHQLLRYFSVTDAEFAILTNGEVYEFYTQLDSTNRMDSEPFMILDLNAIDDRLIPYLELCTKDNFDSSQLVYNAEFLKYVTALKNELAQEFRAPSEEFVKMFSTRVTTRRMTAGAMGSFTELVTTACSQFIKDEVNRRLQNAQELDTTIAPTTEQPILDLTPAPGEPDNGIITTDDERMGFSIIRAICCGYVDIEDIHMRDAKSYCAVLYKNNNRKPIARMYFDRKIPKLGIFNDEGVEETFFLSKIEGIYDHAELLVNTIKRLSGQ